MTPAMSGWRCLRRALLQRHYQSTNGERRTFALWPMKMSVADRAPRPRQLSDGTML